MNVLLVHDTRSVGFVTAAVLARVFSRRGDDVDSLFGHETTRDVGAFWANAIDVLPLDDVDSVVLSSLTFDRRHPQRCRDVLDHIAESVGSPPEIWSHRWPDGYQDLGHVDVYVPPFELVERYRLELGPSELRLLRLSLVMSRQASRHRVHRGDQLLADQLDGALRDDPAGSWQALWEDPDGFLEDLPTRSAGTPAPAQWGRIRGVDGDVVDVEVTVAASGFEEKAIEWLLFDHDLAESAVAVAWLADSDGTRVYLCRRGGLLDRPSLRHLLVADGPRFGLPVSEHWFGPSDALHLDLAAAGIDESDQPALHRRIAEFAAHAAAATTGEREPNAAVAKAIWRAAVEALGSLDLLGRYTTAADATLQIRPEAIRKLLSIGNRGNELRATLIVTITAHSAPAAAFLFLDEGYNLLKLERLLEGVLLGLDVVPSGWLDLLDPPSRLRVDVEANREVAEALPAAMQAAPTVETTSLEQAITVGAVARGSNLEGALRHLGTDVLVVRAQSETIGPSIPYALLLGTTAAELAMRAGRHVRVQDLFAGSGVASLVTHRRQPTEPTIHAVDDSVGRHQAVPLDHAAGLLWLRTDVVNVLGGDRSILAEHYDVIGMDPPHAALFDLLFERSEGQEASLLAQAAAACEWLVIYQGHVTQRGRGQLLGPHLRRWFANVACWQIGHELVLLCGPDTIDYDGAQLTWSGLIDAVAFRLRQDCDPYGWRVDVDPVLA